MAPARDNPIILLSAAVNLILSQTSLLQRLETRYLVSSLPYLPRPPAGYTSCWPPWLTPSPRTQCPAGYPHRTAYGHPWTYTCHDYEACVNACSPYGEPFYANADQNLDAPYYVTNGFVNLAPETIPQPSESNYCDYSDATALFDDAQHLFSRQCIEPSVLLIMQPTA